VYIETAYSGRCCGAGIGPLSGGGKDVVSVGVPPGRYEIRAKVSMSNTDGDQQLGDCKLFPGPLDTSHISLPGGGSPAMVSTVVLNAVATYPNGANTTLHCEGFNYYATEP
jgi:hypothetical protein